jgi:hypothetical protein
VLESGELEDEAWALVLAWGELDGEAWALELDLHDVLGDVSCVHDVASCGGPRDASCARGVSCGLDDEACVLFHDGLNGGASGRAWVRASVLRQAVRSRLGHGWPQPCTNRERRATPASW